MSKRRIAVMDYGIGNQTSVVRMVRGLGHRCTLTSDPVELDAAEMVVLPGVGAFPEAMATLHRLDLVSYLQERARRNRPILGICLGMQLLAESSEEMGQTPGLGLIPGSIRALESPRWHIGWNTVEVSRWDELFAPVDGDCFYFNHSYGFAGPPEFTRCLARAERPIVAAIRRGPVVGLQFHPEKSQQAGRRLLANVIDRLCAGSA